MDDTIKIQTDLDTYAFKPSQKLGEGGFGTVFKGRNSKSEDVAIKILQKRTLGSIIETLNTNGCDIGREIKALRIMNGSINVVQILDSGYSNNMAFIIMEYCNGGSLENIIKKNGKLSYVEALDYLWRITVGVEHLHRKGIMHRDMKPSNILLSDGIFKIGDLGLASSKAYEDVYAGTECYMAPEVKRYQKYTKSVDIYSLSLIYMFMVSGKHSRSIYDQGFTDLPEEIQGLVVKMNDKEPNKRPSAADVIKEAQAIHKRFINTVKSTSPKTEFLGNFYDRFLIDSQSPSFYFPEESRSDMVEVFYKGGQKIPGGKQAKKGGEWVKVPKAKAEELEARREAKREAKKDKEEEKYNSASEYNSKSETTKTSTRIDKPKISTDNDKPNIELKSDLVPVFYKGGQKMPGGEKAKAGGEWVYLPKEKAKEIEARREAKEREEKENGSIKSQERPQTSTTYTSRKIEDQFNQLTSQKTSNSNNYEFAPILLVDNKRKVEREGPSKHNTSSTLTNTSTSKHENQGSSSKNFGSQEKYVTNNDQNEKKFYKGGQFIPGGGRAPAGGIYM